MTKVYLVVEQGGSYEDYYKKNDSAFFDKKEANWYIDKMNCSLRRLREIEKGKELVRTSCEHMDDFIAPNYSIIEQLEYYIEEIDVE